MCVSGVVLICCFSIVVVGLFGWVVGCCCFVGCVVFVVACVVVFLFVFVRVGCLAFAFRCCDSLVVCVMF